MRPTRRLLMLAISFGLAWFAPEVPPAHAADESSPVPASPTPDPFSSLDIDPVAGLKHVRAALELGESKRAAQLLVSLQPTPIGDHAGWLRGRLLREAGDIDGANAALEAALTRDPPSELRAEIEAELGRVALDSNDLALAYQRFTAASEHARDSDRSADLALEIAGAFEKRRLPGVALEVYRSTWRSWPITLSGAAAFERSRWLEKATAAAHANSQDLVRYAERLSRSYRCGQALPLFEEALASPGLEDDVKARARRGHADCLMARRRYPEAAEAYTALLAENPKDSQLAIARARAHGRGGDRRRAASELLEIARRSGGSVRARTRYLAALYLDDLDEKQSLQLLAQVEKQKGARGYAKLARWRLAWADVRAARHAQADARLAKLARGSLSDIEVQRARYWLGKSKLAQGKRTEGQRLLSEIATEIPLSYYGFLSADIVGADATRAGKLRPRNGALRDLAAERARWLLDGGFPEAARLELHSRVRERKLEREVRVELAQLLHAVGDHYRAVRALIDGFAETLEAGIDPAWSEVWELAWPRPFPERVHAAVSEFEGDPALVYAVMREESRFRPKVESPVGARGLMQIIPPTGNRIAEELGDAGFDADQLFVAATNVRFGTYYLEHLLERFSGTRPFAIAAYNAGPEAVRRWVDRDGDVPLDVFVDSVPYGETRRYLRKVLRSMRVYRLLYPDAANEPEVVPAQPETARRR